MIYQAKYFLIFFSQILYEKKNYSEINEIVLLFFLNLKLKNELKFKIKLTKKRIIIVKI